MLDERGNAEGAETGQIWDFKVDFRLNDEGDLELAEFGESCRDTSSRRRTLVSSKQYIERIAMVSKAVQEERTRPLKRTRLHAERGCGGGSVHDPDAQLPVIATRTRSST